MKQLKFIHKSQLGFSLIEIMLAMALTAGLGFISMKLMDMVGKNTKASTRKQNHLQYYVKGLGVVQKYLTGLKPHQFDNELLYRIDASRNFSRISQTLTFSNLTDYSGAVGKLTSHIFHKRMSDRTLVYITVCQPLLKAMNSETVTYANLLNNNLWPFIRSTVKGFEVHCCDRLNPMCNNSIVSKGSDLFVQMYRYDLKTQSLTPILKVGEFGTISSMGFFLFSNQTNDKLLHARFFTFFNECLSQRIVHGMSSAKCSEYLDFKASEFIEEFNYAAESINNLGGEIGF
jgi:prepilin-type N-terminal cleavage/methylation domain-containing protein